MGGNRSLITRWFLVVCVAASALLFTFSAAAQNKADDAKARYLKGVELHDEGDYQSALIEFRRSYELVPNFNVLYNIGQEHFMLADYANALRVFTQYIDEGGKRIPPQRKEQVDRDIDKLRSRVATVNIKVNIQGAELRIDDQVVPAVIPGPVLVSAGKRRVEVSKAGYRSSTKTEDFAGQETKELTFDLQPDVSVINNGTGKPNIVIVNGNPVVQDDGPPAAPIITWSLTGAFAIATGVFGGLALANDSSLRTLQQEPGHTEAELQDAESSARNMAIASDVFLGVTAVGAGLSIYFTVDAVISSDAKPAAPQPGAPPGQPPPGQMAPRPAAKLTLRPGLVNFTQSF